MSRDGGMPCMDDLYIVCRHTSALFLSFYARKNVLFLSYNMLY